MKILRDHRETGRPDKMKSTDYVSRSRELLKEANKQLGAYRIAAVVETSSDFATIHRFMVYSREKKAYAHPPFRDISRAQDWLGVPDGYKIDFYRPDVVVVVTLTLGREDYPQSGAGGVLLRSR